MKFLWEIIVCLSSQYTPKAETFQLPGRKNRMSGEAWHPLNIRMTGEAWHPLFIHVENCTEITGFVLNLIHSSPEPVHEALTR